MSPAPHHQLLINKKSLSLGHWSRNFLSWILQLTQVSMDISPRDSHIYSSQLSLVRTQLTITHLWNLLQKTRASLFTMRIHQSFKKILYNHEPLLISAQSWQKMIKRSSFKERISNIKSFLWKSNLICSKEGSNNNSLITLKLSKWIEAFMKEHLCLRKSRINFNR